MRGLSAFFVMALASLCACQDVPDCGPGSPTHIPHPTDCTKYYTCANGEAVLQECAPGLWWSVAIEGCDVPENADCAAAVSTTPGSPTPTEAPPTTAQPTTALPTTITPQATTAAPDLCGPGSPEHVPHPTDCNLYYTCVGGTAILGKCPPGLWFNQHGEVCDFPENVDCPAAGSTTAVPTTSGGPATEGTTNTGGPSTEGSTTEGNVDLPDCHGETDTLYPHPSDCTKFYKCLAGTPVLQNCPPGLWWHQDILACDWPEQSECTPGLTKTTSVGTTPVPTEPPTELPM